MTDNDDYMTAKTTDDEITELMWDRLQEGINANRRYRLKAVVGGSNMIYDTTKIVWSSDIYIFFTRESDGAWVYNKINANPTTGITCNDNDVLYVTLNDTSTTVLTISSADYTAMPTDDTGRILIFGAVVSSTWYGNILGGVDVTQVEAIITAELVDGQSIDNAIDSLIATHATDDDAHHVKYTDGEVEAVITAELVDGQSIDNAIDSLITTHTSNGSAHHVRYADSEVEAVITAELVNGQSIDNAIDSLIATHAGIAEHPGLDALDDRDFKPNTSDTYGTVRVYFTSLGGMTGTADSDYQDLIIFNSYIDSTGGDINALTFDKSEKLIKHWLADQADGTWGTPKTLAYVSDLHAEAHALATTGPHTGELPLADLAAGTAGDIIIRGASDWQVLAKGTATYVLTMGATYPTWAEAAGGDLVDDTTPQLGGTLDVNSNWIELTAAIADHVGVGIVGVFMASSSGVTLGDAVCLKNAELYRAKASDSTLMPAIGIALETKTTAVCRVLLMGHFRDNSFGHTSAGGMTGIIFVSITGTAGNTITQTAPSANGNFAQAIGNTYGGSYIVVNPSPTVVEVVV